MSVARPAAPTSRAAAATLLVLLSTLTAVGPLSLDMYLPAFPAMARELKATPSEIQLSLTACLFGLALGQLLGGPLSDRWGRRRPVLVGAALYAVCSLLCAFAPTSTVLAVLRLAQGLCGGVGVVVARAIVRDLHSGVAAAKYFSRLTLVFGLAPVAAPGLGSLVLRVGSWRAVFVALAAIGVTLLAVVAWRLPETLPPQRRTAGGLTSVARAVRALLADRIYLGYALTQGFTFAGLFAYISGSSFVFQEVFGLSGGWYSALFALNATGVIVLGQVNARLLDRFSPRRLLFVALGTGLVTATGLLVAALGRSLPGVAVTLFLFVGGVGMALPNGLALALDRHPQHAGTAAAVLGAIQSSVAATAVPLVGLGPSDSASGMALVVLGTVTLAAGAAVSLTRTGRRPARPASPTSAPAPR